MKPPSELLEAFHAVDAVESIAVLMIDDGWDAQSMRVLAAWRAADLDWKKPSRPCPDDGRPTPRAWTWLISGLDYDASAIARAADVSGVVARTKLAMLLGARIVYPDGTISKGATAALRTHVASRLRGGGKRKERTKPESDDPN